MDIVLIILIGIPALGLIAAVVLQLRRETRDRRLDTRLCPAGAAEHLDGNIEARGSSHAAFMARGGGISPF